MHGSWMNQVAQWFKILPRQQFRVADFTCKEDMQAKIMSVCFLISIYRHGKAAMGVAAVYTAW